MDSCIYCIRNTHNDKRYIGSAKSFARRKYEHLKQLRNGTHGNRHLLRAWSKYGESSFQFYVVEYVKDVTVLVEREQYWIEVMRPDYNICRFAGSRLGVRHTDEAKAKVGAASVERWKNQPHPHKGKKLSPETRAKIAEWHIGRPLPRESIAKREATRRANLEAREAQGIFSAKRLKEINSVPMDSEAYRIKMSLLKRGENAKISDLDVLDIRQKWAKGGVTQQALADEYGINQATISAIVLGKSRKYVPWPDTEGPGLLLFKV